MRRLWIILVAALTVGCTDDGVVGSSTIVGTYTLRTVNGAPLPYTMPGGATTTTEILSHAITLFRGGTFAEARQVRTTTGGDATTQTTNGTGTYSTFGTSITFRSNETGKEIITVYTANTLTLVEAGVTSVFRK